MPEYIEAKLTDEEAISEFKDGCLTCEMDKQDGGKELVNLGLYFSSFQPEYTMRMGWKGQNFEGQLLENGEVVATY